MEAKSLNGPPYHEVAVTLPDGRVITIETGRLAKQADGSAVVKLGNTMLLATVVSATEAKEGQDFFPLSVDYREKYSSAGRIPGGFYKREGRLSNQEILVCRLVDRALRPLFPDNYLNETQVMISLISSDKDIMPDALAALAASSALAVSDIPFEGPISEVRVARIKGEFRINPNRNELVDADLDIILAGSMDSIVMVEGEMKFVQEEDLMEAMRVGHEAVKAQCQAQLELAKLAGATQKREVPEPEEDEDLQQKVYEYAYDAFNEIAHAGINDKHERKARFDEIKEKFLATLGEEVEESTVRKAEEYLNKLKKEIIRSMVLKEGVRLDGRKLDEIRPIWIIPDYLPGAHGSALFTRGETQSLTTVTLGTKLDEQLIDNPNYRISENFILHYNFPPFSTGEVKPNRGPSRREIGHGNLAMRSLKNIIPPEDECPYTIRIVSDILESNGSSSMATVCAGSLALMDAGIQTGKHVSGIAMGLMTDDEGNVAILSDILGDEDHIGDMDFKVTGTREGICACQMDIKLEGLDFDILGKALEQAKRGRLHILDIMYEAVPEPRPDYKPHAPRIEKMLIPKDFIGAIIGPGGKVIQEMQSETNTVIYVEEVGDYGEVIIYGDNKNSIDVVVKRIKDITAIPQVGEVYEGTVKAIQPYGAFVEFLPGKEGLLHISEVSWKRLQSLDGILAVDDKVKVKLIDIDRNGKFRLSRKVLLTPPEHVKKPHHHKGHH